MRTLALLTALLLLAFQARAQALQETADQVPAQDQPGAEDQDLPGAEDQDQPGAEDQDLPGDEDQDEPGDEDRDVDVSPTGEGRLTRKAAGLPILRSCRCRQGLLCSPGERPSGQCSTLHRRYTRCCR